jgi:hypothetical protein
MDTKVVAIIVIAVIVVCIWSTREKYHDTDYAGSELFGDSVDVRGDVTRQNNPLVPDDTPENDEDELADRGVESQRQYVYGYHLPVSSGVIPEDMYSRLRYISPGFFTTTGWSLALRPGIDYKEWQRNRWVSKQPNQYYNIWNKHPVVSDKPNPELVSNM